MRYCLKCGKSISIDDKFCPYCGNDVFNQNSTTTINYKDYMDEQTWYYLSKDGKFRKSIGRTIVQVTAHGGSCPICKKWEHRLLIDDIFAGGKRINNIPLLSEAIKDGLFHKGCRHGITTHYPELEDIENETKEEYQNDINYIQKKAYKQNIWKELIIHLILFIFTFGIGNIIYLIVKKK